MAQSVRLEEASAVEWFWLFLETVDNDAGRRENEALCFGYV